jgi:Ni,Fe-hydrogenase maturation factor
VAELLGQMPNTECRAVMQLTPEMAEEFAGYDRVIFVDADIEPGEARLEALPETLPAEHSLGHALSPAVLVFLSRKLFGFAGQAMLCRVPGHDFEEGETLSPEAEASARKAARLLHELPG